MVLCHWKFEFKQYSFDLIARVLQGPGFDTFPSPRFNSMLLSPLPFGIR